MTSIAVLDIRDFEPARGKAQPFVRALGDALRSIGFVSLTGHEIADAVIDDAYDATRAFFALPTAVKARYHVEGGGGERGYTGYRIETAKDQTDPDLKEFWHVGRELSPVDHARLKLAPNLWPSEVPMFRSAMLTLYRALDELGTQVLSAIALELDQPADFFADKVDHGNSILRPLHYPPLAHLGERGVRSAAHEDINLITLLIGSAEPGLEILTREGRWLPIATPKGQIVINVGDMLQRLTNHVLPSTTHRVVNPPEPWASRARFSIPYFLHLNSQVLVETLEVCIDRDRPNRYPVPITANDYLQERLREIRLK